ncbi:MAG: glycogen synthase GlgA [Nitrospira sp.]|nr:glycogen synthase GlgA [Nitrospira sp.]
MAASEAVPYAKTGGLADVVGVLPQELIRLGHEVTVMLPGYRSVLESLPTREITLHFTTPVGSVSREGTLEEVCVPVGDGLSPLKIVVVRCDPYFDRPGLYQDEHGDYHDNLERFALFSQAVLRWIRYLSERDGRSVDVLHLHDWQTALCSVYLKAGVRGLAIPGVKTLLTLHNVGYQGLFPGEQFPVTGLPDALFSPRALEFYGLVNCLKGGIVFSDAVSTVSQTYAKEILTKEFGYGLEGVLADRREGIPGIVNGIDVNVWNPETDRFVPASYSVCDLSGKKICKRLLQRELGLPVRSVPLLAAIGRLTYQKGFDLLLEALPEMVLLDVQLVLLGTGDRDLEERLLEAQSAYPDCVAVRVGFDEGLAHRIQAGADMLIMPSRYEPCGLTQLQSLRYGTVPIVRRTGGLADTIVPFKPSTVRANLATGFQFDTPTSEAMLSAILLAVSVYREQETWCSLIKAGMKADVSWVRSAAQYEQLYRTVLSSPT